MKNRSVAVLFLLLVSGQSWGADPPSKGGLSWRTLQEGVSEAAKQRAPVVLVVPGREPGRYWSTLEEKFFRSKSTIRQLERFILIEATNDDTPEIRRILGDLGGKPALALLDFRQSVIHRWDAKAPPRPKFVRGLKVLWTRNAKLRRNYERAEQKIEKARYALRIEEHRPAVLALLEAKEVPLPPGSDPKRKIQTLVKEVEKAYRKGVQKAEELEEKRDYASAISQYERLIHDFPLPEKQKEWRAKVTELWRRIYQPSANRI